MAQIHTFSGEGDKIDEAIAEAEVAAADFLRELANENILSVQAQTIATPWKSEHSTEIATTMYVFYSHVITIVST
ncbi:MAG: hypothetical protein IPO81_12655 [Kouleothrix sp.]|nr:hypothetical protein [Kouleothrix sp.]